MMWLKIENNKKDENVGNMQNEHHYNK